MEVFKVESLNKPCKDRTDDSLKERNHKISIELVSDRLRTLSLLERLGFPVPLHQAAYFLADLEVAIKKVGGYPIAIKPLNASNRQGITLNINNLAEAQSACRLALQVSKSGGVLVEEYYRSNNKYRILVIDGRVMRAIEIRYFQSDDGSKSQLEETILEPESDSKIDKIDRLIDLNVIKFNQNKIIRDFTNKIQLQNIYLAQTVATIVGLDAVEIEIVAKDLSLPLSLTSGVIINVNSSFQLKSYFL